MSELLSEVCVSNLEKKWSKIAERIPVGRRIVSAKCAGGYMTVILDNGTELTPMRDDEGNGPGALYTSDKKVPILPVVIGE